VSNVSDAKDQNRRSFLHKLFGLTAAAGVAGLLLDRSVGKTLLPPAQAPGGTMTIDTTNSGAGTTSLSSPGNPALTATNTGSGAGLQGTSTAGTGVLGTTTTGTGVQGTASSTAGVALAGFAGDPGAIPIVAQGSSGQSANLQEWRGSSGPLSVVTASGSLGIGTASPSDPLTIVSSSGTLVGLRINSSINEATFSFNNTATGGRNYQLLSTGGGSGLGQGKFAIYDSTGAATRLAIDSSGNVGIGTANPSDPLTIVSSSGTLVGLRINSSINESTFSFNNTATGGREYMLFSTGGTSGLGQGKFAIYDRTANQTRLAVDSSGKVGIGTSSPSHLIQLSGGAYSDGSTWNNASSVRWKENIEPLTDGLDTLRQLHPVSYNYKKTPAKRTMGFIAEEVGKVLPTVADWDKTEPGYAQGYDHVAILALAVQSIREQQRQIDTMRSEIRELKQARIS